MKGTKWGNWLQLLICNLIWATQFVMLKIVQVQLGPVSATFYPMAIATACLLAVVWWRRRRDGNHARVGLRTAGQFALIGVLGQVAAQLLITWGVRYTLASNAALLTLTLPVVTAVMAYLFLGEKMSALRWIAFGLAIAGVLECSDIEWGEVNLANRQYLLGNALVLASIAGSAFYNVYSKRLLTDYPPLEVLLYSYYAALAVLFPITIQLEPDMLHVVPQLTYSVWGGLMVLSLLQYFVSMVLFLNVLSRLDATQAALSNYMIPFFGVVVAAVMLHETLSVRMMLGGLLVLASTLVVTVYEGRRRPLPGSISRPTSP